MRNCLIELVSQTASFRDPEFQNFHKALPLPTPTNVIGLVGAALGLPPMDAQTFFEANELRIGISGNYRAKSKDLWKYCKEVKELWKYHPNMGTGSSIVLREFLFNYRLKIVFQSHSDNAIEKIMQGFDNPFFFLTFGNSDSLAHVVRIQSDMEATSDEVVKDCMLEGDLMMQIKDRIQDAFDFSLSAAPAVYHLPTAFSYESAYGKREISRAKTFSLITGTAKLNYKVEGVNCNGLFIPLITF